jgi:hypothetical protein
MSKRRWLWLLLAVLCWPAVAGRAPAQDDTDRARLRQQSHLSIPLPQDVSDPQQAQALLEQRLHRAQSVSGLQKMLEDPALLELAGQVMQHPDRFGIQQQQIDEIKRRLVDSGKLNPDLNDPELRNLLGKVIEKQGAARPDAGVSPEQLKAWERLARSLPTDQRPHAGPDGLPQKPGQQGGPTRPTPIEGIPSSRPEGSPGRPPDSGKPAPAPEPPDAGPDAQARFTRELVRWAENLQKMDPALKDSSALKDFVRKLSHYTGPSSKSFKFPSLTGRLGPHLPPLAGYLHLERLPDTRSLVPRFPRLPTPRHGLALPAVGGPGLSRAARDTGTAGWPVLLWVLVGLGFGILFWRLLAWQRERVIRSRDEGWRLGPWPVRPAAVATRADLVRAFDYLALLSLGPVARAWNHLEIAARLGADAPAARREAADRLALLYEQARYAPPDEPLPEAALAAARRHLCLLAGVPAA